MRERFAKVTSLVAAALLVPALGAGAAAAKSCPNSSVSTVNPSGGPSYTYERGCVVSKDGTPIVYNLFEPTGSLAPGTVYPILEGPGWGGAGATAPDKNLISQGYAELTWDPRGFGQSGGVAEVDAPYAEGRDVSALIDKVLTGRAEIATDMCGANGQPAYSNDTASSNTCGQPVVGMTGGSYGGGIQFATAAFDGRVKAIVPVITWNNLNYSLWPGNVIKLGWGELLYGAGLAEQGAEHVPADVNQGALSAGNPSFGGDGGMQIGGYDPMIHYSEVTGGALGYPDRTTLSWFGQRSQAVYGAGTAGNIGDVPTLLIQGTVDTLFNLNDAWANYQEITGKYQNLPVKMIAFCGGHVSCPTGAPPQGAGYRDTSPASDSISPNTSAGAFDEARTLDWFNHYLKNTGTGDGMPANVVYQDQNGGYHALSTFPTPSNPGAATYVSKPVSATLLAHNAPTGTGPAGIDTAVTDGVTSSSDPGQMTVPLLTAGATEVPVVGIGHVNASVSVAGAATELFFRLVDKNTGEVVDLQTVPCRVDNLDAQDLGGGSPGQGWAGGGSAASAYCTAQSINLDLPGVAYDLPAGHELDLQISTSTDSFAANRGSSVVTISNGTVSVPTL